MRAWRAAAAGMLLGALLAPLAGGRVLKVAVNVGEWNGTASGLAATQRHTTAAHRPRVATQA